MYKDPSSPHYRPYGVRAVAIYFGIIPAVLYLLTSYLSFFMQPDNNSSTYSFLAIIPLPQWISVALFTRALGDLFIFLTWGIWTMKPWAYWITTLLVGVWLARVVVLNIIPLLIMPADVFDFLQSIIAFLLPGYFVRLILIRSTRDAFFKKHSYPYPHNNS